MHVTARQGQNPIERSHAAQISEVVVAGARISRIRQDSHPATHCSAFHAYDVPFVPSCLDSESRRALYFTVARLTR